MTVLPVRPVEQIADDLHKSQMPVPVFEPFITNTQAEPLITLTKVAE